MRQLIYSTGGPAGLVIGLLLLAVAQIQAKLPDFDLNRLNVSTASVSAAARTGADPAPMQTATYQSIARTLVGHLDSSDAKSPPVYVSAPKQISGLQDIRAVPDSGLPGHWHGGGRESSQGLRYEKSSGSGGAGWPKRRAAGSSRKKVGQPKKKKKWPAKKPAKKRTTRKWVVVAGGGQKNKRKRRKNRNKPAKRRFVKTKRRLAGHHHRYQRPHHHNEPIKEPAHDGAGGVPSGGKYYEYRSVPSKGAWRLGFRRGNDKHAVQRKEYGHKSHFKTEVKWTDKDGKGHQLFDYNHGDHGDGHHSKGRAYSAAAAASKPVVAHPATGGRASARARPRSRSAPTGGQVAVVGGPAP